ncbi:tRNA (cytosine(34)-C(5))-methyltransferase, mitochondrial isoform X1 [Osmerus eperlanus]|uniref:tRNA (cytosine(34)-C(5))-methyltransferase, mitochondrial isoform X1 n=1 Tax=Osmerus eperlanus TaxID=29151 RepID=UPI002E101F71
MQRFFISREFYVRKRVFKVFPVRTTAYLQILSCKFIIGSKARLSKKQATVPVQPVITKSAKRRQVCQLILDQFEQQYSKELGPLWLSAKVVLLNPQCWQYGVMLNRFTSVADITRILKLQGFTSILPSSVIYTLDPVDTHTPQPDTHPPSILSTNQSLPFQNLPVPIPKHNSEPSSHHNPPPMPSADPGPFPRPSPSPHPPPVPSLQCLIHTSPVRFPSQSHRPGQLKQYYLLNAASLLPVLALEVRDGDRVLDLCSAPGGKALAILQTAHPALLCCNEVDPNRRDWLVKTLESFLPHSLSDTVTVCNLDGRTFGESQPGMYDKVLVDVPCSNDRSWLFSTLSQQGAPRLRERRNLPNLQTALLRSALQAVRPGGVVVYSTCTLSRAENQEVVEAVLSSVPGAELDDLEEELVLPLSDHFTFAPPGHAPSGILVVPHPGKTWGPMFVSRIKRTH